MSERIFEGTPPGQDRGSRRKMREKLPRLPMGVFTVFDGEHVARYVIGLPVAPLPHFHTTAPV